MITVITVITVTAFEFRDNTRASDRGPVGIDAAGRNLRTLLCWFVSHDIEWLKSDRRYPDESAFPHLATIAMVETTTERGDKIAHERRYYISSAKLDAKTFALAVRAHWGVENRLHWVLDVIFHDDLSRLRSGFGPQNMAVFKHMAMNMIRKPKDKHSLKSRRTLASLNQDYMEALIRQSSN